MRSTRYKVFIECTLTVIILQTLSCYVMLTTRKICHEKYQQTDEIPSHRKGEPYWGSLVRKQPGGKVVLSQELQEELDRRLKAATNKKIILVWMPPHGKGLKPDINKTQCGNCKITYDRTKIDDENVGAVIFHFSGIKPLVWDMTEQRNPNHLYIFWSTESTASLKVERHKSLTFENAFQFNSTMTYRRDSGIYESGEWAGTVESIIQNNNLSLHEILNMKSKLAIAIVSNCDLTYGARMRMRMLKELDDLKFGLEAYGSCFGRRFPQSRAEPSFKQAVRKYKFYFAFENARHCKDYISEKFFNDALLSLSVPVVWGSKKEDYEAVAPPGSFIHAEDFPSMTALSEYLRYLDRNDKAYLEYLKWITMIPSEMPQHGRARGWCHICRALHGINIDDVYNPKFDEKNLKRPLFTNGVAKRTVKNLIDLLYGKEDPECFKDDRYFV